MCKICSALTILPFNNLHASTVTILSPKVGSKTLQHVYLRYSIFHTPSEINNSSCLHFLLSPIVSDLVFLSQRLVLFSHRSGSSTWRFRRSRPTCLNVYINKTSHSHAKMQKIIPNTIIHISVCSTALLFLYPAVSSFLFNIYYNICRRGILVHYFLICVTTCFVLVFLLYYSFNFIFRVKKLCVI